MCVMSKYGQRWEEGSGSVEAISNILVQILQGCIELYVFVFGTMAMNSSL